MAETTTNTSLAQHALRLCGLSVGYGLGHGRVRTVAGPMSATAPAGSLTCLIGRNGTGKSTLLRTLAGFQPALAGAMTVGGERLAGMSLARRAAMVSVVLTERPDADNATAMEMVAMGRTPYTGFWGRLSDADRRAVAESMRLTGTAELALRRFATLSDGERQRVMVAKALAQATPVVLLDEPTAFLDFPGRVQLMRLLLRLAHDEGKTVLLSTHDLELALQLADRLWLLADGQLVEGTGRELAAQGCIDRFVGDSGIDFDARSMTLKVTL